MHVYYAIESYNAKGKHDLDGETVKGSIVWLFHVDAWIAMVLIDLSGKETCGQLCQNRYAGTY